MKKRFLMLLAALLLILLAIPALIGAWIRSADAQMLLAPLSAQTGAQFIKGETRGGWFHSHIEFDIHWPQLSQILPDSDVYRLHLHIRHGPLFFSHRGLEAGLAYAAPAGTVTCVTSESFGVSPRVGGLTRAR